MGSLIHVKEEKVYSVDGTKITIPPKRQRRRIDRAALNKLKASIETNGQLQPGVCSKAVMI